MQMDTLKPQKVKARKTKVIARKSTVQILSNLFFRAIEITVVIVTIAKLFYQLVITFENSGERFKGFAAILTNRHFVFLLGNAIVIALFAKYGQFPNQASYAQSPSNGFYEEFVRESIKGERTSWAEVKNRGKQSITDLEGKTEINTKQSTTGNRQKQSIAENEGLTETRQRQKQRIVEIEDATETRGKQSATEDRQRQNTIESRARQNTGENRAIPSKSYVRSRSENLENPKISCGRLRRSETERFCDSFDSVEKTRDLNDQMSNDELRYKIESFIARQRRNQKDEEFCIT